MELNEVGSVSSEKELEREDSGKNYLILHGGSEGQGVKIPVGAFQPDHKHFWKAWSNFPLYKIEK